MKADLTAAALLIAFFLPVLPICQAAPPASPVPGDVSSRVARVRAAFQEAQERWRKETNSVEAAWHFGRGAFDWAELATNDNQRASIAEVGIAACRKAIALDPKLAAPHYYLGLNLGQMARTKLLGALKLIDEMEAEWLAAIRIDPQFDFAGAHRSLGILYRDAPGWPTSVGSEKKSRRHLEKAVELHPEYPGNRLSLFEGYIEWGEKSSVRAKAREMETFLKKARESFSGEDWILDWKEWEHRWEEIKRKADVK
jgi:tetratricopeptide (TPR) repeat protein